MTRKLDRAPADPDARLTRAAMAIVTACVSRPDRAQATRPAIDARAISPNSSTMPRHRYGLRGCMVVLLVVGAGLALDALPDLAVAVVALAHVPAPADAGAPRYYPAEERA